MNARQNTHGKRITSSSFYPCSAHAELGAKVGRLQSGLQVDWKVRGRDILEAMPSPDDVQTANRLFEERARLNKEHKRVLLRR